MKKLVRKIAASLALVPLMAFSFSAVALPATANAAVASCNTNDMSLKSGADCAQGKGTATNLFKQGGVFRTVVNILLFLIGAIAVIMLIIGGIRYVVSAGDQNAVTGAKNTILYAIVGIIVAFLAYAAVNFILDSLSK